PLAGFVTQELREGGRRVGFAIGTFDGAHGVLGYVQRTCFAWISRQIAVTPDRRRMVAKGSVLTAKPR
ncbi:MAG TPA: hypothetical protein VFM81_00845, partial [Actinomycetota bacterium]|nr:hypothetical protein [Actinomycetota bacterium]